jgi:hypothetical protein
MLQQKNKTNPEDITSQAKCAEQEFSRYFRVILVERNVEMREQTAYSEVKKRKKILAKNSNDEKRNSAQKHLSKQLRRGTFPPFRSSYLIFHLVAKSK